ncbi:MAG TPA: hypothetical protein VKA60_24180 [Blastocatellia bacterium]|nr:hypothetical protein [Blastocatellia bacterium]
MEYAPDRPNLTILPCTEQVVRGPVQALSQHAWRILNDTAECLTFRVRCILRDDLGNEAIAYDDTSDYPPGEYAGSAGLEVPLPDGYDQPQVVFWIAETYVAVVGLPFLPRQSSSSKSVRVIPKLDSPNFTFLAAENDTELLFNPLDSNFLPVRDMTEQIQEISKRYRPSEKETAEFLERRQSPFMEDPARPFAPEGRISGLDPTASRIGPDVRFRNEPVNFIAGVLFKERVLDFINSTGICFYILAPTRLSSDPVGRLYLTSSNRADHGCEALVRYENADQAMFLVWDWSTSEQPDGTHFVVALDYAHWDDYKLTYNLDGVERQALYVMNFTRNTGPGQWKNEVYLLNRPATGPSTFDRIYQRPFPWTPPAGSGKFFDFGPYIETFVDNYGDTDFVGFADAKMVQDDHTFPLTLDNSRIRPTIGGFRKAHLDPNFTFLARSRQTP